MQRPPILPYGRSAPERRRRRPVLSWIALGLGLAGVACLCFPPLHYLLNGPRTYALLYPIAGSGLALAAILRSERSVMVAIAAICLHVLSAALWFALGGWAYF